MNPLIDRIVLQLQRDLNNYFHNKSELSYLHIYRYEINGYHQSKNELLLRDNVYFNDPIVIELLNYIQPMIGKNNQVNCTLQQASELLDYLLLKVKSELNPPLENVYDVAKSKKDREDNPGPYHEPIDYRDKSEKYPTLIDSMLSLAIQHGTIEQKQKALDWIMSTDVINNKNMACWVGLERLLTPMVSLAKAIDSTPTSTPYAVPDAWKGAPFQSFIRNKGGKREGFNNQTIKMVENSGSTQLKILNFLIDQYDYIARTRHDLEFNDYGNVNFEELKKNLERIVKSMAQNVDPQKLGTFLESKKESIIWMNPIGSNDTKNLLRSVANDLDKRNKVAKPAGPLLAKYDNQTFFTDVLEEHTSHKPAKTTAIKVKPLDSANSTHSSKPEGKFDMYRTNEHGPKSTNRPKKQ